MANISLVIAVVAGLVLVGCQSSSPNPAETETGRETDSVTQSSTDSDGSKDVDSDSASEFQDSQEDTGSDLNLVRTPEEVCGRWNEDRADIAEESWDGSVAGCNEGTMSNTWRAKALKIFNLYRYLVALPEVTSDPYRNSRSQGCALFLDANDKITHDWPDTDSYACYSAQRAEAATDKGFIASSPAVGAVDLFIVDPGASNFAMLGHRRYVFHHKLGPIGIGSTADYSCMWAVDGTGTADPQWTAYPPPGPVPLEALSPLPDSADLQGRTVNDIGWSFQSKDIDFAGATVTVRADNVVMAVVARPLGLIGSLGTGIAFVPNGWTPVAGTSYEVTIGQIAAPVTYVVDLVDCTNY